MIGLSLPRSASDPVGVCTAMFTPRSGFDRFVRGLPVGEGDRGVRVMIGVGGLKRDGDA